MAVGAPNRTDQRRALWIALIANGSFLLVEVIGGIVFGSIALLADAAHMLSDVAALAIAIVANVLVTRPGSSRHTYGYQRAEVLAAQINGLLLLGVSVWIAIEAIERFKSPRVVASTGLMAVASAGLVVNVFSAIVVARASGSTVNMKGVFYHLAADSASSVLTILAGVAIAATGQTWFDPAASLAITAAVIWAAIDLLHEVSGILLEAAPKGMSVEEISSAIASEDGIESIHHLHLWNLASDVPALSAHVVIDGDPSLHEAQAKGDELRRMLEERFGIAHATLELECHECEA